MPDSGSEKEQTRTAYLFERINEYVSEKNKNPGSTLCAINDAAYTIALEAFNLETEHIHPNVVHAEMNGLLCRHKIIAATQCAIMRHAPLRNNRDELRLNERAKKDGRWPEDIRRLNARFACAVALDMLEWWMMEYQQPAKSKECLNSVELEQTYRENIFWLTHSLSVSSQDITPRFPFFLLSQFWSMIDRYAIVQGGGSFPEYGKVSRPVI